MEDIIHAYVAARQHVTFAALARDIPGFRGDLAMSERGNPSLLYWPYISREGLEALNHLLQTGRLHAHPVEVVAYTLDLEVPRFPTGNPGQRYRSPRWLPLAFCTQPFDERTDTVRR